MSTALHPAPDVGARGPAGSLTERERVLLTTLDAERTLRQIAAELYVSRNTAKSQLRSVYRKLGVCTRADAVARARELGLS